MCRKGCGFVGLGEGIGIGVVGAAFGRLRKRVVDRIEGDIGFVEGGYL